MSVLGNNRCTCGRRAYADASGDGSRFWYLRISCPDCAEDMPLRGHVAGPNLILIQVDVVDLPPELRATEELSNLKRRRTSDEDR